MGTNQETKRPESALAIEYANEKGHSRKKGMAFFVCSAGNMVSGLLLP
jgi:hypothetical protein